MTLRLSLIALVALLLVSGMASLSDAVPAASETPGAPELARDPALDLGAGRASVSG